MDPIVQFALKYANTVSVAVLLVLGYVAGLRGAWVWRREYDAMATLYERLLAKSEQNANYWRDVAMNGLHLTEHAEETARTAIAVAKDGAVKPGQESQEGGRP